MSSGLKVMLVFSIFSLLNVNLLAQKQNNQWRFGFGGAIDFNSSPPGGVIGCSISTPEGSASVADRNTGALLFYTDGITVFDENNQVMSNGFGLLGGTPLLQSSTSGAVIIPKPFTPGIYYIVTIDEQSSGNGVRYSIVDMALNSGLGDVISNQKNIFLYTTTSEKLQVVPTSDGCGYWLITHDNPGNTFVAFKLTQNGFDATPVLSTLGGVQGNGAGHMKINRQFNKIALGSFFDSTIELFDFDQATGKISNPVIWDFNFQNSLIYGVAFSPDGSKLYVSNLERIIQYDLNQATSDLIEASAFEVSQGAGATYTPASLQLGPDDKIYIAAGSVDAINSPNNAGLACGFQRLAIAQQAGTANYGLPQWIYFNDRQSQQSAIAFQNPCVNEQTQFSLEDTVGVLSYNWNFGDPVSGPNNTSDLISPSHSYAQSGSYIVQVILNYACNADTITQNINISNCGPGISGIKINGDTCATLTIAFQAEGISNSPYFFWRFGDPASASDTVTITGTSPSPFPNHTFSSPGIYTVCVSFQEPGSAVSTVCRTVSVGLCEPCNLYAPNAFSPNGDGANDSFGVISNCEVNEFKCAIFNRWGELVYESNNPSDKWNGQVGGEDCPIDVYVYKISYKIGSEPGNFIVRDLTLLR